MGYVAAGYAVTARRASAAYAAWVLRRAAAALTRGRRP